MSAHTRSLLTISNDQRNLTMLIGFLTAFPLSLAMMCGITDMDAVLGSALPSAEVFYQISGSKSIMTFQMTWIILIYFGKFVPLCSCPKSMTLNLYSVSNKPMGHGRSHDLGFRKRRKICCTRLHEHLPLTRPPLPPVRTPLLQLLHPPQPSFQVSRSRHLSLALLLLHLRPPVPREHDRLQFDRDLGRLVPGTCRTPMERRLGPKEGPESDRPHPKQNITYAVPQGIIVARGRKRTLPPSRPFNLGRIGYVCNVLAPLLVATIGLFICFPPQLPVTAGNANYTPPILAAMFLIILALWFTIGRKFKGPKIDWEGLGLMDCK